MGIKKIAASYLYTLESDAPLRNGYIEYDEESAYEQILADISSTSIKSKDELNRFYNDIDVRIYYLNEEEFSNVVEMLEIYATPDN